MTPPAPAANGKTIVRDFIIPGVAHVIPPGLIITTTIAVPGCNRVELCLHGKGLLSMEKGDTEHTGQAGDKK
jgi:hypothetical protein